MTDSVKRCKNVYCPKFIAKTKKLTIILNKKFTEAFENKQLSNKTLKKIMNKTLKKVMNNPKYDKKMLESCLKGYCNPSCKNTIFEAGMVLSKTLVTQLKKSMKTKKNFDIVVKILRQTRKNVFGKKQNVLVNSFYEKLPKKQVDQLIKDGALSGCSLI
jgi:hypothetical protein